MIASPMKDVCDGNIAREMSNLGGLGIIHRFLSIDEQVEEFKKCKNSICAIGTNGDFIERFYALCNVDCRLFCIDVANGASKIVEDAISQINNNQIEFIVGNVASKECYGWVQSLPNVVAIRVGIAGGEACTTKTATGIYHKMISCISECATVKKNTALIADGGIKEPGDMCKAIAYGADVVMMGSVIAATIDSPAELIKRDGKFYKVYHGSASFEIQKEYREKPRYIEGQTRLLEYNNERLENVINRFCDGLRSSMSYFNAKTLDEFRRKTLTGKIVL